MTPISEAIEAASNYGKVEDGGVVITSARSLDFVERWILVEAVRKTFRRVYLVDRAPNPIKVHEMTPLHHLRSDPDMIEIALSATMRKGH